MNQTPARTTRATLLLRLSGPSKAVAQVSTKTLAKTLGRTLGLTVASAERAARDADGMDVVCALDGLSLLEFREAWAAGLLATHQGVTATEAVVYEPCPGAVDRETLQRLGSQVVRLSRR